jgi:prepilin-type N-terminal cleavage/methylation domain-containing protein
MHALRNAPRPQRRAAVRRGLSLVELMVGITIGLIVVAGATLLTATQLSQNRRLLLETQVQQDLRAAADIITREIRRGGYTVYPHLQLWSPDEPTTQPPSNFYQGLVLNNGSEVVAYRYMRPNGITPYWFGYQWTAAGGVIRHRTNSGTPQDLTDRTALVVTDFSVVPVAVNTRQLACPSLCADGTQNCWPTITLNDVVVTIKGHPVTDAALERTVTSRVRMRNDGLEYTPQACP